ncbi:O-methyltransferase [Spirosoma utsteinense]|uniref:O-methyltransferase YrrM n=1 Tax=Spirosoma utsteinense TaxID=2585773 RepID=A0ABR6WAC1_9BACT|nr:O-methyltransferase [Spirosoma utsteinense]MBC3783996.1 putative O-methyltransferase YrrM [Spirosoma utsteinense]MBC3793516.1 putative O-methyltransferase YrrM [Spirosoma utsteinense]
MDFLPADLTAYAEAHTSPETELLSRLSRNTRAHVMAPRMLSGHLQGRFLSMIAHLIRPRRILEIGTYTGYSALCLAEGLTSDGRLITIDHNEELESFARSYWQQSPLNDRIELRIGYAADVIPTLDETFDLIFIDADKRNNALYFDLVIDSLRPGGLLLVDNVLWSGKVIDTVKSTDQDTAAVLAFNKKIQDDPRVDNVLLPIRDGIMMIRKS